MADTPETKENNGGGFLGWLNPLNWFTALSTAKYNKNAI